jgi:hypothetical protein
MFGPNIGAHSGSAVGMAELPFNIPVEIEAKWSSPSRRAGCNLAARTQG